jgi:hypothetical protein
MHQYLEGPRFFGSVMLLSALWLSSCEPHVEKTELMKRLERDGAGDLSKPVVTEQSIQQWLGTKGMPYAVEIRGVCREMVKARPATAEWLGTVDGKICRSAETLAFFNAGPPRTDPRTFVGGNQ